MKARILAVLILLVTLCSFSGCFGKYPDLRKDIVRLRENFKLLRADYEPLKSKKDGKPAGLPSHRPFGVNEEANEKSRKTRLNLFDESDKLCADMLAASNGEKKDDEKPEKEESK